MLNRTVLLYSGGCKFCRWVARMILRLDKHEQLSMMPFRSIFAEWYLHGVPERRRYETWWIWRNGALHAGDEDGMYFLLLSLRRTRELARTLRTLRLLPALQRFEQWVKRSRPLLSRFIDDGPAPLVFRAGIKRHVRPELFTSEELL